MRHSSLTLISPCVAPTGKSEAELFGAMTWLWMQSSTHRHCPLHELERLLMPALKTGQFVLALDKSRLEQPVGLLTWANFSAKAEQQYLHTLDRKLQSGDWQSGDRPWILDWVAPFGHSQAIARATQRLLNQSVCRTLHHKGDQRGLKVLHLRGLDITEKQAAEYWAARPLPLSFS